MIEPDVLRCYDRSPSLRGVPTLNTDAAGAAPPDAFGPFRVLHQIGAGALGPVFRAYQPEQDRLVAVKWFRLDLPPERVHQLVADLEQLIALDLSHAGLAAPLATGLTGMSAYLAQDFVAADSLDVVIRDSGPARAADAMRVAAQLGSAVDAAAALQVVHGALHPRDVLLTADDARMTGFGVTRALERVGVAPPLRRPYTAPERIAGLTWDHRADLFSIAALVYEYLTGRRVAGVGADAVGAIDIPGADAPAVAGVFAQALAGNPADRFDSGLAFVTALEEALSTRAVVPAPVKRPRAGSRKIETPVAPPPVPVADDAPLFAARAADEPEWQVERDVLQGDGVQGHRSEADLMPLRFDDLPAGDAFEEPAIQLDRADDNRGLHIDTPVRAALREDQPAAPDPLDLHLASAPSHAEPEWAPIVPEAIDAEPEWSHSAAEQVHALQDDLQLTPESSDSQPEWVPTETPDADLTPAPAHAPDARRSRLDRDRFAPGPEASRFALDGIWPLTLALVVGVAIGFGMALVLVGGNAQAPVDEIAGTRAVPPPVAITEEPIVPEGSRPPAAPPQASTPSAPVTAAPPGIVAPATGAPTRDSAPTSAVPPVVHEPGVAAPPPAPVAPPTTGRLQVRSTPTGATVMLDGKSAGVTPLTVRDLSRGRHTVRVTRDGYVQEERTITITERDASPTVTVALARVAPERRASAPSTGRSSGPRANNTPKPAAAPARPAAPAARSAGLLVESRPAGARVTLDGRVVGVTPLTLSGVDVGEHAVTIERSGYRRWAGSVTVEAGERNRVAASLEQ